MTEKNGGSARDSAVAQSTNELVGVAAGKKYEIIGSNNNPIGNFHHGRNISSTSDHDQKMIRYTKLSKIQQAC
jgi:hypothetical protein